MKLFNSLADVNSRPPALRDSTGMRDCASGIRMSIGTPDAIVHSPASWNPRAQVDDARERPADAAGRWAPGRTRARRSFGSSGPFPNGI